MPLQKCYYITNNSPIFKAFGGDFPLPRAFYLNLNITKVYKMQLEFFAIWQSFSEFKFHAGRGVPLRPPPKALP